MQGIVHSVKYEQCIYEMRKQKKTCRDIETIGKAQ